MIKVGRSDLGRSWAKSHSGHLAGSDAVTSAVFRQFGITRVAGLRQARPRPRGCRRKDDEAGVRDLGLADARRGGLPRGIAHVAAAAVPVGAQLPDGGESMARLPPVSISVSIAVRESPRETS